MGSSLLVRRLSMLLRFTVYVSRLVQRSFNRIGPPVVKFIDRKVEDPHCSTQWGKSASAVSGPRSRLHYPQTELSRYYTVLADCRRLPA